MGDPRKTDVTDPPRESEERFRTTFAQASVGMAIVSPEGRYLEVNRAFCEITGYTEAELLATDFQSITHPEDLPDSLRGRRQLVAGEIPGLVIEKRYVRKDGGVVWVQTSIALARDPAGEPQTLVTLVHDVTLRKRAEQALRENEEELRGRTELLQTIFDNVPAMIAIADRGGRVVWANREWQRVLGWSQAELEQVDVLAEQYPDPADRAEVEGSLRRVLPGWREFRTKAKDGRILNTAWANVLLSDGRTIGIGRDLTDRKRTAEALQRAHDFAENIIEAANVIFVHLDAAGIVRKVNAAAEEITGYKRAEVEGTSWFEALVPRDRYPYVWEEFERIMAEGAKGGSFENPILNKQGEERQILWRNTTLREGDQIIGLIAFGMDVTDLSTARKGLEALSRRLVHLQEEERRAIARELHDEVGQLLTGLGLMIETGDGPGSASRRQEMKRVVTELIGRVRDLSMKLRPPMLDELGLLPTLLWQIERFEVQTAIHVDFRHANLDRRFPSEIEITTFHTVQEALNNVARHAGVTKARVEVWAGPRSLGARIEDEGRGFVVETALGGHSSGLAGMRERCRLLGGQVTIESTPGTGTRLSIELPLSARPARGAET